MAFTRFVAPTLMVVAFLHGSARGADGDLGQWLRQRILAVENLSGRERLPDHMLDQIERAGAHTQRPVPAALLRIAKRSDDFDAMRYFDVFEHLSMEKGYVLDWVYDFDGIGGQPVLYARKAEHAPFASEAELKASVRERARLDEVERLEAEHRKRIALLTDAADRRDEYAKLVRRLEEIPERECQLHYLERVHIDGTRDGYLEYALLYLLGSRFCLYWHALSREIQIVSGAQGLGELKARLQPSGKPEGSLASPRGVPFAEAAKLDLTPRVTISGDAAVVTIVTFSKWNGFVRESLSIGRAFPHITKMSRATLVPYSCGLLF